jgi:hypothetical protein
MPVVLPTPDALSLGGLAEWYAARRADWPVQPRFDPTRRWYARLGGDSQTLAGRRSDELRDVDHEAWLLTWLPGQSTDLHDHGGSSGAFTVLEGRLDEQLPVGRAEVRLIGRGYSAGATRPFGPRHVHRMVNAGAVPSITVHVYSPALTRMTRYALDSGRLEVAGVEREGEDW